MTGLELGYLALPREPERPVLVDGVRDHRGSELRCGRCYRYSRFEPR